MDIGRVTAALALLACLVALTGCKGATSSAEAGEGDTPQRGGTLTIASSKEPAIINPWLAQGAMAITSMLVDGLNEPIVTLDEKGAWQPIIAERVPTPENGDVVNDAAGMRVRFTIREQAAWSDGTPLRCDDVVFTWETVMNPDYMLSNRLGWDAIRTIECPSERDVVIHFSQPYALYMSRILALGPLPKHALEGKDFNTFWNDRITVSSGPYEFVEWQRGVKLVLKRSDSYWNAGPEDLPYPDRVVFRFVKDANTLKMQLRMTESDVAFIPADTNLVQELEETPDVKYAAPPGALVEQLVYNTAKPPLDDRNVRLALSHVVDREMIAKVVLRDQVPVLQSTMVPTQPVYESTPFARYKPDKSKAEQHMKAAGYERGSGGYWEKDGKRISLKYVAAAGSYPFRTRVGQLLEQQLETAGFEMTIQLITPEVLYSAVAPHGKFDLGEWSEITGNEPAPALLYTCNAIPKKPQWAGKNRFRYCNPKLDRIIEQADATVDVEARADMIRQIDATLAEDAVMLPLFQSPDTVAWNKRVGGIVPNPASLHTWNIERWWVAQ